MIYNSTIHSIKLLLEDSKFYQKENQSENGEHLTIAQSNKLIEDAKKIIEDLEV